MDVVAIGAALQKAKAYTDSVALNGVSVRIPMIDLRNNHWLIFDPMLNAYVDTGVPADGGAADLSHILIDIAELQNDVSSLKLTDEVLLQLINDLQLQIDNLPSDDVDLSGILSAIATLQFDLITLEGIVDVTEIDISDLKSKLDTLEELIGDGCDLSSILADIQVLQSDFQTLENDLSSEITNREQAITDKQQQIAELNSTLGNGLAELNSALQETNRVLSGKVTQTLESDIVLNTVINGETDILKARLASSVPLIGGGSWVNDTNGTLAIYVGDRDSDTAIFRTKTTSISDVGSPEALINAWQAWQSLDPINNTLPFEQWIENIKLAGAYAKLNGDNNFIGSNTWNGNASFNGSVDIGGETPALRSDGYLFRISRLVNINIASGAKGNLLQGFAFPDNIERMANTTADQWGITPNGALVFKAIDGYVNLNIDVRLSGTISGVGPGNLGEFSIELVRPVAGVDTVASERGIIGMGTLNSKSICFESYTHTVTDPFITDGVRIELNNTSASAITITGITVVIKGTKH